MAPVLFNSARPLGRCENITAVWDAYCGDKVFMGGSKGKGGFVDVSEATADVVVTDEFVRRKRPGQQVVMIAHGLTGGKLYGADQRHGIFRTEPGCTSLVDWYVVSSEHGRRFAASASGIPIERCVPLGMPRTDRYVGARRGDGGTEWADGRRIYLYAPTFRSRYDKPRGAISWALVDSLLDDGEMVVVKWHMNSHGRTVGRRYAHVMEVPAASATWPWLLDCDVLATDFSSIMFDAHLLGRPVVLTCGPDDPYLETRGMYMDYPDGYSSRWIRAAGNEEAFVETLREAAGNGPGDADAVCRERTSGACDGHASERVCRLVELLATGHRGETVLDWL